MLFESLGIEVTLLDAHSFAWILSSQMEKEKMLADVQEYTNLPITEREAIVKARIGQGQFRQTMLRYWEGCSVTRCREEGLLEASHIKPWKKATILEKLSLYNGLLLTPTLHKALDGGFIAFNDDGKIIISDRLSVSDARALGIHEEMCLHKVEIKHIEFLLYHRENIFE